MDLKPVINVWVTRPDYKPLHIKLLYEKLMRIAQDRLNLTWTYATPHMLASALLAQQEELGIELRKGHAGRYIYAFKAGKMTPMSTFAQWLAQQTERQDLVGRFARDATSDAAFPRNGVYEKYEGYLIKQRCSERILRAFERAWREYNVLPGQELAPGEEPLIRYQ